MTDTFIELDRHLFPLASKSPDEDQTDTDPAFSHAMPMQCLTCRPMPLF
jgi:hypothetical protein